MGDMEWGDGVLYQPGVDMVFLQQTWDRGFPLRHPAVLKLGLLSQWEQCLIRRGGGVGGITGSGQTQSSCDGSN